jgi:DNA-binding NarL/FixJ family response regulator
MARETLPQNLTNGTHYDRGRQATSLLPCIEKGGVGIRVCVIHSQAIMRTALRLLLEREERIEVVCEAPSGEEAVSSAARSQPSIVLIELGTETSSDLDLLPRLVAELAPARVLVLTRLEDPEVHLAAMENGASGVVMLKQAPEVLMRAICAVSTGQSWIGQAVSAAAIAKLSRTRTLHEREDREASKIALLTAREREIVGVVSRGYNGSRIAAELGISEATVRHHITSILAKLELSNKLELAVYAFNNHLGQGTGST